MYITKCVIRMTTTAIALMPIRITPVISNCVIESPNDQRLFNLPFVYLTFPLLVFGSFINLKDLGVYGMAKSYERPIIQLNSRLAIEGDIQGLKFSLLFSAKRAVSIFYVR